MVLKIFLFQLLLSLSCLQFGCRLTTADTYSHASEGCMELRYTSLVPSLNQPLPPTTICCYKTCWYQFSVTVCPTQSLNCTFKYKHSSVDRYVSSESLSCVYIFTYLSMYFIPNRLDNVIMLIGLHTIQKLQKKSSPSAKTPTVCNKNCYKKREF